MPFRPALPAALLALAALPLAGQLPGMNNVVINQIQPDTGNGQGLTVELYNYGPNQALDGWTLEFLLDQGGAAPVSSVFVVPAAQTIPRHGFFRMHWAAGVNGYLNVYRGAGALALSPNGELRLCMGPCAANGVDYLRWGTPAFNDLPGNLAFRGSAPYGGSATAGYMQRMHDANSRSAMDWTINPQPVDAALNPGQYGVRRHALLLINEVRAQGGSEVEIANPQDFPVDLTGMMLAATRRDGLFCSQQPLAGMLQPGGFYLVPVGGCSWGGGSPGGEVILTHAGGEGIDYMTWGSGPQAIPPGTTWSGPALPSGFGLYSRMSILDSDNSRDFLVSGGANYTPGAPNPGQQFGGRYQEFGGEALSSVIGTGLGAGTQVTMTQTAALTEFRVRANNPVSQQVGLGVYESPAGTAGPWTLVQSADFGLVPAEDRVFLSGPSTITLGPPSLTLTAGRSYRFMIYGAAARLGQWRDGSASTESFRYGTVDGMASDNSGYLPATQTGSSLLANPALQATAFSFIGQPVIDPPTLPGGQTGVRYTQQFSNSEGTPVSSWSYSGTAIPGLAFDTVNGRLDGFPSAAGTYNFTISATAAGLVGSRNYTVTITYLYDPLVIATASPLPGAQFDYAYGLPLAATGGNGIYTWYLVSGSLPQGVELTSSGVVSGMPLATGTYNFYVSVVDGLGNSNQKWFALTVTAPLRIVNTSLPAGYLGVAYPATTLAAAGGTAPYTFSLDPSSPPLPAGIAFSAGTLTGKPTAAGVTNLVFRVTDSAVAPGVATRTLALAVGEAPPIAQWEGRGLFGGSATVAASPNFATDSTLFAYGSLFELYRSDDGGRNWLRKPILTSALSKSVDGLALSPVFNSLGTSAAEKTLYVVNDGLGVYRSTDRGDSFTAANGGLPALTPLSGLAVSPANASRIFVTYSNGATTPASVDVYGSWDGGTTWSKLGTMANASFALRYARLFVSPTFATDNTIFTLVGFGIGGQAFMRSTDGGVTWSSFTGPAATSCGTSATTFRNVIPSPRYANDRTLFVEDSCGVLSRSLDGGTSFTTLAQNGVALAGLARPGQSPLWYLKNANALYGLSASDNQGDSFTPVYAGGLRSNYTSILGPQRTVNDIVPLRRADGTSLLLVGDSKGVDGSLDNGQTFNPRDRGLAMFSADRPSEFAGRLAVASGDRWMWSADGGLHWVRKLPPWPALANGTIPGVDAVAIAPVTGGTVLFIAGNSQMYRSLDGGQTWSQIATIVNWGYQIAFAPGYTTTGGAVFFASQQGLWKSTDGGATFARLTALDNNNLCTPGGSDDARSVTLSPNYALDSTLFAGTYSPCRSTDGGVTWTQISAAAPAYGRITTSTAYFQNAASNANNAWTLFAGSSSGVVKSVDRGASWTAATGIPGASLAYEVVVSPNMATDSKVFAFSVRPNGGGGIYRSTDNGTSFAPLGAGDQLFTRPVQGMSFVSGSGGATAVATTAGGGLWRTTDGGLTFLPLGDFKFLDSAVNALAMRPITTAFSQWVAAKNGAPAAFGAVTGPAEGDLLAGTDQGVFISHDSGESFDLLSAGLGTASQVRGLRFTAPAPASPLAIAQVPGQAASSAQIYRLSGTTWAPSTLGAGNWNSLTEAGAGLYATRLDGLTQLSTDGGVSWAPADALTNLASVGYNASTGPTALTAITAANTAPYWAVSATAGARYSATGANGSWTPATGSNDYTTPVLNGASQFWSVVQPLGVNATNGSREVLAGSNAGLYRTLDGGQTWRQVDVAGSGLEATSRNFSAVLTATTPYATTDVLVGVAGTTTGGVYLSGDGGQHWTQVNQGFDPANLSISSLVKTSCAGCPVQYYSGTYGSGVYTRTITVSAPPTFPVANYACWGSTSCTCATGAGSGPEQGGQAFKLCGSGFQAGIVVEFDGIAASGCAQSGGTVVTCTGTPPHAPGAAVVRVRNPDTRAGTLPAGYTYLADPGARAANSLRAAKNGGDAWVSWNCASCAAASPARLYRSQNAQFSLYLEQYNGGPSGSQTGCTAAAGTNSCYANSGAVSSAQSYFWSVE